MTQNVSATDEITFLSTMNPNFDYPLKKLCRRTTRGDEEKGKKRTQQQGKPSRQIILKVRYGRIKVVRNWSIRGERVRDLEKAMRK
jgi:hypothetical protein